ncbi:MAG: PEP-CTERM sorting domain-containing protein [Phycisphaerae bacterium]
MPDREQADGMYLNLNHSGGLAVIQMTPTGRSELEVLDYISAADQTQVTITAVRMLYDPVAEAIQYDVDFDYTGDGAYAAFSADQSTGLVSIPDATITAWNGGSPSSVVFGGDSDDNSRLVVRNLVVIPEPATLLLMSAGGLAVALKRGRS